MERSTAVFAIIALSLSLMISGLPSASGGYPGVSILDPLGDTVGYSFSDRSASGYPEIDIISLETLDRITRVEAYLTLEEDVESSFGYIYSMSIGGVSITYDNGTFETFRISDQQMLDDIDVRVSGSQMIVEIPKVRLEGEFLINATAQKYLLDFENTRTIDNYYDSVSGQGDPAVSQYQVLLEDDRGDVRFSYLDKSPRIIEGLDILSITLKDTSGPLTMEMVLDGEVLKDPSVTYSFSAGEDSYGISDGEPIIEEGLGYITGLDISGKRITISVSGEDIEPGVLIGGSARQDMGEGGWVEDICPETSSIQMDIMPIDTGKRVEMELTIEASGQGTLIIATSDLRSDMASGLRDNLDSDLSGTIEQREKDAYLEPLISAMEEEPLIRIGGEDAEIGRVEASLDTDGSMEFRLTIDFKADLGWGTISVEILPLRKDEGSKSGLEMDCSLLIEVPSDHYIDPFSLEPFGLGNSIAPSGSSVVLESDDPEDLDLFTTGIIFEVDRRTGSTPGEDPVVYEDIPGWAYFLGAVAFIIAVIVIYRIGRGKKRLPEDY